MSDYPKIECTCIEAYTSRKMRDPNCCACSCDYNDVVEGNQQLKQRIDQLERELEGMQCIFANENGDPLIDPFNSENLFKWLNRNDIEQQEKGVNHIGAMLTGMGWCGVESLCKRAIEQLRKGVE